MKTEKFCILADNPKSVDQDTAVFTPRKPLHKVETNLRRDASGTVITPKDSLLGRAMAKARKRTKESSVQTEEAKIDPCDPCDNEVTAADLTGDVPSEAYWKKLAQSKSKALDDALEANRILSERLKDLEEMMKIKDEMLDEARAMAEVIRELAGTTESD